MHLGMTGIGMLLIGCDDPEGFFISFLFFLAMVQVGVEKEGGRREPVSSFTFYVIFLIS